MGREADHSPPTSAEVKELYVTPNAVENPLLYSVCTDKSTVIRSANPQCEIPSVHTISVVVRN
jgi:hypothetical protein